MRIPLDSNFVTKGSAFWAKNQSKWVERCLDTWHTQLQRGISMAAQRLQYVQPQYSGDKIEFFCEKEHLDRAVNAILCMDKQGTVSSVNVYRSLLKECARSKSLGHARRLHAHLAKQGLESSRFLAEYLVSTLVKCGGLQDALHVFHRLPQRTVLSWTAVISGYTMCGRGREALSMYKLMQVEGVDPNAYTFVSLLKACGSIADFKLGKHIHLEALKYRCESDSYVGNCLVEMYAKCGSLVDAWSVFVTLSERDVVSWTVMLTAYAQQGLAEKALQLYTEMHNEGVSPNNRTFVSALQACGMLAEKEPGAFVDGRLTKIKSLETGKAIHVDAKRKGYDSDVFVGSALIHMYGKCRSYLSAQNVFYRLSSCDVVAWNAMLVALVEEGQVEKALHLYEQMWERGVSPNHRTFVTVLQACGILAEEEVAVDRESTKVRSLEKGKAIHNDALRKGCDTNVYVANTLVSMYGKCGSSLDAQTVFSQLSNRDVVSWNVMLGVYAQQSQGEKVLQLYAQMKAEGASPDARTFVAALHACRMLAEGEECGVVDGQYTRVKALRLGCQIHADAQSKGYESDIFVGINLVCMYGKCGSIVDAQNVFDRLSQRDVVAWTSIVAAYVEQGQAEKALELYQAMWDEGVSPNDRTFVSVLQACGILAEKEENTVVAGKFKNLNCLEKGKAIHADAQRKGYGSDIFVASALVSMYRKCGSSMDAWDVFDGFPDRDVVLWNAMLMACVEEGQGEKALQLFEEMQNKGVSPSEQSFVSALQACGMLAEREGDVVLDGQSTKVGSLEMAKALHADARRKGFESDGFVVNTIISTYGKCGSISYARSVFNQVSQWNLVSWNAMLATYVQQGQAEEAMQLYKQMQEAGMSPDARSFVTALQACGMLAVMEEDVAVDGQPAKLRSLALGKAIHANTYRKGYDSDGFVRSSLVTMYGRCRCMKDARKCFDGASQIDMVSWNAMLSAYVEQGQAEAALELYIQMRQEAATPDAVIFVSALQACNILAEYEVDAMVDGRPIRVKSLGTGKAIHAEIQRKGCDTNLVGSMLIRLYGKCGSIGDAYCSFDHVWQPELGAWNAILAAYVEQGSAEKTLQLYEQMREQGVSPSICTIQSTLEACRMRAEKENAVVVDGLPTKLKSLEMGKAIHAAIHRKGYDSYSLVGTKLLVMYGTCGSVKDARNVFGGLPQRDVVVWNATLLAYVENGEVDEALELYEQMRNEHVSPDGRTLVTALQACSVFAEKDKLLVDGQLRNNRRLEKGKEIHDEARRKGYETDAHVGSALVSMYGKCGSIVDALSVFDRLPKQSVPCWNAMLLAFVEQGQAEMALQLYKGMQEEGVISNSRTCVVALQACGILGEKKVYLVVNGRSSVQKPVTIGKEIHAVVHRMGLDSDVYLASALVKMYGKCGCIEDAWKTFTGLLQRDVVLWNAMLMAYVWQGYGEKALQLYGQMQQEGSSPNNITLVCTLQACSKTGTLGMVRQVHQTIYSAGNYLSPFIASALISAYGRCASMVDGQRVFDAMPQHNVVVWNALIAGYCRQGDSAASLQSYENMQVATVKPNAVTFVSILAACSHAGLVDKGAEYFESMSRDHGIAPEMQHYLCMVDLFGRAGFFTIVETLLSRMPTAPDLAMWLCLLGACRKHGKVALGERAFGCAVHLDPEHAAAYVLMSNIYADAGLLDSATKVRQQGAVWKKPGKSWIEHGQNIHSFLVGDIDHPQRTQLYQLLRDARFGLKQELQY